jgi:CRISPR system Cascade subunit CasE
MIYLTRLVLNPRCRQVREDLADPYELHRTLLRAFPDAEEGGPGRILYRVEPPPRNEPCFVVLVQSEVAPDWSRLERSSNYLLESPPPPKPFNPALAPGQRLCFRLRANPTVKRDGKRRPLLDEAQQRAWLSRKGSESGFRVERVEVSPEGASSGHKPAGGATMTITHHAVRFDGLLAVADPERLGNTLKAGIGSAKGFGFGLLSLARPEG